MAEAVVSMVIHGLRPLGSLMIQQAMFFKGVGDKVEIAQTELLLMQGFLKDADARQENEEVVRLWVNIIREAAYDLEDAIESFVLKVALKREASVKVVLKRFACFLCKGLDRYKIGLEIESITTKLSKLRSDMQSYDIKQEKGNEGAATSMRQRERRLTYPHVIDHDVVGLGDDTEMLATNLVEEKGPQVVTIWGMGGSGKTTLAKQIYNHTKVKSHFDCFAWVCISQQCDGTAVMKEIFIKLSGVSDERRQGIASLSNDEVAERLCNFQRHRKCLVVIDDIWTFDAWKSFKGGFSVNEETESRILLTTRNREVASLARGNSLLYESQALSADESWNLFRKIAFFEMDDTNSQIYSKKEELGKNMLQHCAGLPLAIIVLAGLLARKDTIDEWETVHKNVNVYIRRGTDLEREYQGKKYEGASWVLALSYDNLPYRLKLCFLYLANFPEDYEIRVKRLTQLWMTEGLISTTSTEMMEDVSYSCLSELVERCMVQVVDIGLSGKIKTCRLHDLMRDLSLLKAEEENFLHVVNFYTGTRNNTTQVGRVRRVAMYVNSTVDQLVPTTRGAPLRSLLYFGPQRYLRIWNIKKVIRSVFNDFKLLRVLKLEDMEGLKELPSTIGNLVHLRFLSLKNTGVQNLPSSVANLVCLQTLDLRTDRLKKIPNVFKKMEQLRHLYLPRFHKVRGELSLATACNLQTLVNVECRNCDFNALVELYNLRKLSIQDWAGSELWKKLEGFLRWRSSPTFHHLRSLSLKLWGHDSLTGLSGFHFIYKLRLVGSSIKELPENLLSFPNLIKIKLYSTQLKGDQVEILEKLPHLRVLYLQRRVFSSLPSNTLVCSNRGFRNLEFLSLRGLPEMKEWRVEEGAMPRLSRLCIEDCEQLRAVPDGLQYVATLKELTVKAMPSEFCSRLGEDGEDFHKIKQCLLLS
ncbi:putative P-loop containing nucleoside triphosphate hydrolase, leucine-rich repeat domain, L [Rosa chinensis]|uniref:Putative P-loop containing nucleoside triphosphate hydrolase, leucine-rich repeat domain, L n=1 Tax=Rosa chinensis TaxID=74649 RepID=A0A2P6SHX1_ROSCH|nr:putative disease resistance protein At1g50180 [Rosa chinensis]PRQ58283.1 putative P-loop containing nucleoside triphosphate hydrolase, leucine-rich repeat domain, L [Rosa chinensis]